MDKGRIIREGRTEDVFSNPKCVKGAEIMGYRNIAKAYQEGGWASVPSWGLRKEYNGNETITAAAIDENDIEISSYGHNAAIIERIPSPDSDILSIMLEGGKEKLWMKAPKGLCKSDRDIKASIPDDAIKLLST